MPLSEESPKPQALNMEDDVGSVSTAVEDVEEDYDEKDEERTGIRTSEDLRKWDRETIGAEEEAERLLTGSSSEVKSGGRFRRGEGTGKMSKWARGRGEDIRESDQAEAEVMYRYSIDESGVGKEVVDGEEEEEDNSEANFRRLGEVRARSKVSLRDLLARGNAFANHV